MRLKVCSRSVLPKSQYPLRQLKDTAPIHVCLNKIHTLLRASNTIEVSVLSCCVLDDSRIMNAFREVTVVSY